MMYDHAEPVDSKADLPPETDFNWPTRIWVEDEDLFYETDGGGSEWEIFEDGKPKKVAAHIEYVQELHKFQIEISEIAEKYMVQENVDHKTAYDAVLAAARDLILGE